MSNRLLLLLKSGLRAVASSLATDAAARLFALILIAVNAIAIGGPAIIEMTGGRVPRQFDIMSDRSYPEMVNYAQAAICSLLLLATFVKTRQPLFLGLAVIFVAVGLDDALSYHERFGTVLTQQLSLPAIGGLRKQDSGELLAWILEAIVLAPLLLLTIRGASPTAAAAACVLALCVAGLALCGAGLDMLHVLVASRFVGYLEDGGEMICIAAACISAFVYYRAAHRRGSWIDGISDPQIVVSATHAWPARTPSVPRH